MLSKRSLSRLGENSITLQTDENGRLTSGSEIILQNLLISTDLDFKLISKITGLEIPAIIAIYIKYNTYIDKIILNSGDTEKDNEAIDKCLDLLIGHINSIVEYQKVSQTKLLRATDLTNILRILDRLVAIKNTKISQFDKLSGSLIILTTKIKAIEEIESGKLELSADASYNFNTIADKLDDILDKTNIANRGNTQSQPIYVLEKGQITKYPSIVACTNGCNIGNSTLYKWLDTDLSYKGRKYFSEGRYNEILKEKVEKDEDEQSEQEE